MNKPSSFTRYAALSVTLAACADRDPRYSLSMAALPPAAAGSALVYVQPALARAVVVDLGPDTPAVRQVPVGGDAVVVQARVGANRAEALVLSRGQRGSLGVAPASATLTAVSAGGAARRWTLGSPFNALAQNGDGRYAIGYFQGSSGGRLLFNPNEVAVVDLDRGEATGNPTVRTVRSFGGVPNGVVFSPPMNVGSQVRTLAVVLSDAYVTLLDLTNPARGEITVRLTLPDDVRAVGPSQVIFDADNATMYLRADQSNDLYVLRLVPVSPRAPTDNDFRPSLNQLAAGVRPADIALFGEASARKLLVVSPGSRDARVIDTVANTTTVIPLDAVANRILLFNGVAPTGSMEGPQRALLYATQGAASAVSFVELNAIESRRSQNVETLQLGRVMIQALPLPDRKVVMFGHPTSAMGSLSLLNLDSRTASPIFSEVALESARFDDDRQALWVAPRSGERLGYIELGNFRPGELRLDAPVVDVVPVARGGSGRRVVALHDTPDGWMTVLTVRAGEGATREQARSVRGFLLSGLLDEGEAQ